MANSQSRAKVSLEATDAVLPGLSKIVEARTQSDFILACCGAEWHVHKVVLMMHAKVLFKMSSEANFKNGRIDSEDEEPDTVTRLVQYLYNLTYSTPQGDNDFIFHVRMFFVADKYNIPHLAKDATAMLQEEVKGKLTTPEFACAIAQVYSVDTGMQGMRVAMVRAVQSRFALLAYGEGAAQHLVRVMGEHLAFATDMVIGLAKQVDSVHEASRWYRHSECPPFASARISKTHYGSTPCYHCLEVIDNEQWKSLMLSNPY